MSNLPETPAMADILKARAEGRAEALQILIGLDAESGIGEYTGWSNPVSAEDEGSAYWEVEKLRDLFRVDDALCNLFDRAEAMYWEAEGHRDEAKHATNFAANMYNSGKVRDALCDAGRHDLVAQMCSTAPAGDTSDQERIAMLLEVIATVRQYPDFDAEDSPFGIMLDEALAGKRPTLLGTIDALANGVMPERAPAGDTDLDALRARIAELEQASDLAIELQNMAQSDAERAESALAELRASVAKSAPLDGYDRLLLTAGAESGDPGAMSLAAQLAGVPPCPKCQYRKEFCRCAPAGGSIDSRQFVNLLNDYAHAPKNEDDPPYRAILAHVEAYADRARTPQAAPAAVPEGFQLVPKRLPDAMIEAAMQAHYGKNCVGARGIDMAVNGINYDGAQAMRRFWKGALAAAPTPPAQPAPSLFDRKLADLQSRGYEVIGRILHKDGEYALFDDSCRWLTQPQYQRLMHEQDGSLFAVQPAPDLGDLEPDEAYMFKLPGDHAWQIAFPPLPEGAFRVTAYPSPDLSGSTGIRDAALEEAAAECERMKWFEGARQASAAHQNVWEAAAAIRALLSTPPTTGAPE